VQTVKRLRLDNQRRLRDLVAEHADDLTVFSAHDQTEFARLGQAPVVRCRRLGSPDPDGYAAPLRVAETRANGGAGMGAAGVLASGADLAARGQVDDVLQHVALPMLVISLVGGLVANLLSMAVVALGGGRITRLTFGAGPTVYRHVGRRMVVEVKPFPIGVGFRGRVRLTDSYLWHMRLYAFVATFGVLVLIPVAALFWHGRDLGLMTVAIFIVFITSALSARNRRRWKAIGVSAGIAAWPG